MHNQKQEEQKVVTIKFLAIFGLIVAIIIAAWLSVQIIRVIPSAIETVASLFEREGIENTALIIVSEKQIVNSSEPVKISWTNIGKGTYSFSYSCADSVYAQSKLNGELITIPCNTSFILPYSTYEQKIIFSSSKERFVDVSYTISFSNDNGDSVERTSTVTIVNPDVDLSETPEEDVNEVPATEEDEIIGYTTVSEWVTTYPVSNPNGYTDLSVTMVGIGAYNAITNVLTPLSSIRTNDRYAVRFIVKNIGTKTSGVWTTSATLPSGETFISGTQPALKPNEQQITTLVFDVEGGTRTEDVLIRILGGNDTQLNNNHVSRTIRIRQ